MSLAATGRGGRGQSATYGELESKPAAGIALSPGSAYLLCITGNYQRASRLRDRSCSRLNKGERSHACSRCYRRKSFFGGVPRTAEFELREMRAATETTIIESRSLMREVDVLLYPPPKGWLRMP
jgi:hypothetical protein